MKERIAVACAANQKYFEGLAVMVYSLVLLLPKNKEVVIYIINGGIKLSDLDKMQKDISGIHPNVLFDIHKPDMHLFKNFPKLYSDADAMAYSRFLFTDIIQEPKYLYIDVDILVTRDVSTLWEKDFKGQCVFAVQDPGIKINREDFGDEVCKTLQMDPESIHLNSGILFIDTIQWKKKEVSKRAIQFLQEYPEWCTWHDQSALNYVLNGSVNYLDYSWNMRSETFDSIAPVTEPGYCIHYVSSKKPWLYYGGSYSSRLFYLTYATLFDKKKITVTKGYKNIRTKYRILVIVPLFYFMSSKLAHLYSKTKSTDLYKTYRYWSGQKEHIKDRILKKSHQAFLYHWEQLFKK